MDFRAQVAPAAWVQRWVQAILMTGSALMVYGSDPQQLITHALGNTDPRKLLMWFMEPARGLEPRTC